MSSICVTTAFGKRKGFKFPDTRFVYILAPGNSSLSDQVVDNTDSAFTLRRLYHNSKSIAGNNNRLPSQSL